MAIIFLTVQAMKGGAVEFLTKPFSDGTLLSKLFLPIEKLPVQLG